MSFERDKKPVVRKTCRKMWIHLSTCVRFFAFLSVCFIFYCCDNEWIEINQWHLCVLLAFIRCLHVFLDTHAERVSGKRWFLLSQSVITAPMDRKKDVVKRLKSGRGDKKKLNGIVLWTHLTTQWSGYEFVYPFDFVFSLSLPNSRLSWTETNCNYFSSSNSASNTKHKMNETTRERKILVLTAANRTSCSWNVNHTDMLDVSATHKSKWNDTHQIKWNRKYQRNNVIQIHIFGFRTNSLQLGMNQLIHVYGEWCFGM